MTPPALALENAFTDIRENAEFDVGARRAQYLRVAKQYREQIIAAMRTRHYAGAPGCAIVEDYTAAVDAMLRALYHVALAERAQENGEEPRCALVALGGYGRGALFPHADLDVMLVHDKRLTNRIEDLNSFLLYFLYDAGFKVGHSLRSIPDALKFAHVDDPSKTAMMEARLIAGNAETFEKFHTALLRQARTRGVEKFLATKQKERERMYRQLGADVFVTEPHVKQGAGGLRDYQTGLWIAIARFGLGTPRALWDHGLISEEEFLRLDLALDFVYRVRLYLHFEAGMQDDHLTLERQEQLARAFAYEATDMAGAVQLFMQDYYQYSARLHQFYLHMLSLARRSTSRIRSVMTRLASQPVDRGLMVSQQKVMLPENEAAWFREDPVRLLEVPWYAQKYGFELSDRAIARIRQNAHLIDEEFCNSPVARDYFLAMLNTPARAGSSLRVLDSLELLGRYLPEFVAVRGLVRYGTFHQYPVDEHTLRAVENLALIGKLQDKNARTLKRLLASVPRPDLLALGLLLHDIGKVDEVNHVDAGIEIAENLGARMGLPATDLATLVFLIRQHLVMNKLSQYRDMDDPKVIQDFAEEVGTADRLDLLYLLTFCDMNAVREGLWTEWKSMLLLQLYRRTHALLTGEAPPTAAPQLLQKKRTAVSDLLATPLSAGAESHLQAMRPSYLRAFQPEQIAEHITLAESLSRREVAFTFAEQPALGCSTITIVTKDRPGLFAMLAGALASLAVNVLEAEIFTRDDGVVIDVFRVSDSRGAGPLGQDMWETVRRRLRQVVTGERRVEEILANAPNSGPLRHQPLAATRLSVSFDNQVSDTYTVIDVEAGDRMGLLFDIATTLAHLELNLAVAKITTDVRQTRDAFYVCTRTGAKLSAAEELETVRAALQQAAGGDYAEGNAT